MSFDDTDNNALEQNEDKWMYDGWGIEVEDRRAGEKDEKTPGCDLFAPDRQIIHGGPPPEESWWLPLTKYPIDKNKSNTPQKNDPGRPMQWRKFKMGVNARNGHKTDDYTYKTTWRRIIATRDIPEHGVKKGDYGGWIEHPGGNDRKDLSNISPYDAPLSQKGSCWIGPGVRISKTSRVEGDALVLATGKAGNKDTIPNMGEGVLIENHSTVRGNAKVKGDCINLSLALVDKNAKIEGTNCEVVVAAITDNAEIKNSQVRNTYIYENAKVSNTHTICSTDELEIEDFPNDDKERDRHHALAHSMWHICMGTKGLEPGSGWTKRTEKEDSISIEQRIKEQELVTSECVNYHEKSLKTLRQALSNTSEEKMKENWDKLLQLCQKGTKARKKLLRESADLLPYVERIQKYGQTHTIICGNASIDGAVIMSNDSLNKWTPPQGLEQATDPPTIIGGDTQINGLAFIKNSFLWGNGVKIEVSPNNYDIMGVNQEATSYYNLRYPWKKLLNIVKMYKTGLFNNSQILCSHRENCAEGMFGIDIEGGHGMIFSDVRLFGNSKFTFPVNWQTKQGKDFIQPAAEEINDMLEHTLQYDDITYAGQYPGHLKGADSSEFLLPDPAAGALSSEERMLHICGEALKRNPTGQPTDVCTHRVTQETIKCAAGHTVNYPLKAVITGEGVLVRGER